MQLITQVYEPIAVLAVLVLLAGLAAWARDARARDPLVDHARRVARVRRFAAAGRRAEARVAGDAGSRAPSARAGRTADGTAAWSFEDAVRVSAVRLGRSLVALDGLARVLLVRARPRVAASTSSAAAAGRRAWTSGTAMAVQRSRAAGVELARAADTAARETATIARETATIARSARATASAKLASAAGIDAVESRPVAGARRGAGAVPQVVRGAGGGRPAPRGIRLPTGAEIEATIRDAEDAWRSRLRATSARSARDRYPTTLVPPGEDPITGIGRRAEDGRTGVSPTAASTAGHADRPR